jgi:hypothetical protein
MADLVVEEARKLYVYAPDDSAEPVFDLLTTYLDLRRDEFATALEAYARGPEARS